MIDAMAAFHATVEVHSQQDHGREEGKEASLWCIYKAHAACVTHI